MAMGIESWLLLLQITQIFTIIEIRLEFPKYLGEFGKVANHK